MEDIRQARILIRDRKVSGGDLPSNAIMSEPFVNLYDGVMKFSGVTGGSFEGSSVASVFEVGSNLYNSRIKNRFNINDSFIINGSDGIISTYGSASGAGLTGKFLSGTTGGFVLAEVSDIQGTPTVVQSGNNTSIGGTSTSPIVNVIDSPVFLGMVSSSGLKDSSLNASSILYAGIGGKIEGNQSLKYESNLNLFKTPNIQIGNPGDVGVTTTIFGDVVIVGESISGFTSELYIEDNIIELNYNPTASTISTSIGAGFSIQDGSGIAGTDVFWDIRGDATGLQNRSLTTNIGNIRVAESGSVSSPNGLFLIKSSDIIDGGSY